MQCARRNLVYIVSITLAGIMASPQGRLPKWSETPGNHELPQATTSITPAKPLSALTDIGKKYSIEQLVDSLRESGGYSFPAFIDPAQAKKSLLVGQSFYEFGAKRVERQHRGTDFYGFKRPVFCFRDGTVESVGRYVNAFDHGNAVVVNHGEFNGYKLQSIYMHVGGLSGKVRPGAEVKTGQPIGLTDCTGISLDNQKLIVPNSETCRQMAHLHFQLNLSDGKTYLAISAVPFFPEYAERSLEGLPMPRVALPVEDICQYVRPFKGREASGSFPDGIDTMPASAIASSMYELAARLYHSNKITDWKDSILLFQMLINMYGSNQEIEKVTSDAGVGMKTLQKRLK